MRSILAIAIAGCSASWLAAASPSATPNSAEMAPEACDPRGVVGNEACVKCHQREIVVWRTTLHARTFDELHRRPEAKQIAGKLGLSSVKHSDRCTGCHYTAQMDPPSSDYRLIAGVSCESCHGAARTWLDVHHDYGGEEVTRASESATHREQRLRRSIELGMRNPANPYLVAQSCLRCHTTADEQLVNVGGHPAGSLDFELVSWSQGSVRHNFIRSDGAENAISSPQRLRVLFVAGMIAELEASLRATAVATTKASFGVTVAKRAARAGARLKSVTEKVDDSLLEQVVAIFESVTLKLNNAEQLNAAADEVARLGYHFAATREGTNLEPLDRFIPTPDRWK